MELKVTLQRINDRIAIKNENGAEIAKLFDGQPEFIFDPLADTEYMLSGITATDLERELAAIGMTPQVAREIDAMPAPDRQSELQRPTRAVSS